MKFNTIYRKDVELTDRIPLRPIEKQQPDFTSLYDYDVLFYDVFIANNCLVFIGPRSEASDIAIAMSNIMIDGVAMQLLTPEVYRSKKVVKILIHNYSALKSKVEIFDRVILPEYRYARFEGSRVLYTIQKNNSLNWIKDWIHINNTIHSINNFIIYDNGSSDYEVAAIEKFCSDRSVNINVFSCPFLYGPGAFEQSDWDSDYLQNAMFEHVRYSFFNNSGYILNGDIDEIIPFSNLFDLLNSTNATGLSFKGYWVYANEKQSYVEGIVKHSDHTLIDRSVICSSKWLVDLSKLNDSSFLNVHTITASHILNIDYYYLHFSGISNNWKYNRLYFRKLSERFTPHNFSLSI